MRARHQYEIERLRERLHGERLAMEASRAALLEELEAARREWNLAKNDGPGAEMDFFRHLAARLVGYRISARKNIGVQGTRMAASNRHQ